MIFIGLAIFAVITVLFWQFPPVRVVAFCFFLICLDLYIKGRKWEKEDKEKERQKQEKIERLRKLKRGKYLYLDYEPWYQKLQGIEVEEETSPPDSSQEVDSSQDSSEPEEPIPRKQKRKRQRILDKLEFLSECRCLYRQSKTLVKQTRKEVNCEMSAYNNKSPNKPKFHKRD